jgi:hypothetical protein
MGGFVKFITRAISGASSQPPVVQKVEPAPVAQTAEPSDKTTRQKLMGSGYGGQTIMTSASGVEDEANTQKTILGGGRKRKIKA